MTVEFAEIVRAVGRDRGRVRRRSARVWATNWPRVEWISFSSRAIWEPLLDEVAGGVRERHGVEVRALVQDLTES